MDLRHDRCAGHEGQSGQHIIATRSEDRGRTWSDPVPIEPPDGPEASWAQPLRVPETGRIYVFYTYNAENRRVLKNENGEENVTRVDSFGTYAYRYSDDGGRSWSADRYTIPMRPFEIDRENVYGGEIFFFWGVGKPSSMKTKRSSLTARSAPSAGASSRATRARCWPAPTC